MLLINDEQIAAAVSVKDCVEVMELAFKDLAAGEAVDTPRGRIFSGPAVKPGIYSIGHQCAILPRFNVAALRVTSHRVRGNREPRDNHLILLYDLADGRLLAMLHGFTISGMRVGATTALAAKYMAPKGRLEVGVLGSGKQARTNLEGVAAVADVARVKVYSPNPAHRELFRREMAEKLGIEIRIESDAKKAVESSDIVLCASNASQPIFDGHWIKDGALVVSLRNSDRNRSPREVDETTIRRSAHFICCSKAQIQVDQQREWLDPIAKGVVSFDQLYELTDLAAGKIPVRRLPNEIAFYHSNSASGIQFAAAGYISLQRVKQAGNVRELPDEWFFTDLSSWWEKGLHPSP
ncbi:MAG: ornithine cyclodeaminase family protein [Deltaproteobacteria bacterium]|nr:ornithine cyclodeaminase family protein [Deltaproteobacteria bacterium]